MAEAEPKPDKGNYHTIMDQMGYENVLLKQELLDVKEQNTMLAKTDSEKENTIKDLEAKLLRLDTLYGRVSAQNIQIKIELDEALRTIEEVRLEGAKARLDSQRASDEQTKKELMREADKPRKGATGAGVDAGPHGRSALGKLMYGGPSGTVKAEIDRDH